MTFLTIAVVLSTHRIIPLLTTNADRLHMQAALDALRSAENQLQAATHDKGGHRQRALELVRRAIQQVEQGVKFDRRH
jgi:adenylosuccinate lyase